MVKKRKQSSPPTHQQLLEAEIDLDQIAVTRKPWKRPQGFVAELEYAVRPHIHEGRLPNYGAIVAVVNPDLPGWSKISMPAAQANVGRSLADGIRSFALFVGGEFVGLVSSELSGVDEAGLVDLALDKLRDGAIITSDARGIVRIVYPHGVAIHRNRRWSEKPLVNSVIGQVSKIAPTVNVGRLSQILSFASHALSPRHIGATLVWCLQNPQPAEAEAMKSPLDLSGFNLNTSNENHRAMLRHLLSQTDGATIIAPDGKILGTGSHLKVSDASRKLVPASKGTRHTSAQRFSYDFASGLVIAVSADGPVTIYSDGANVAQLDFRSAHSAAEGLAKMVPEKKDDISASTWTETCSRCGKSSRINEVVIIGFKDHEAADCPVCGVEIASSMCFTISACKRRLKSAAGVMCVTRRFKSAASSLTMKHVSQYERLD